ncbi:hypothetical protein EDC01DRAFT_655537 [Geopyxis carbonaria]|nr:hypothetical protein EDC01DRAFT_655537 [Geopyxis carbonaria]
MRRPTLGRVGSVLVSTLRTYIICTSVFGLEVGAGEVEMMKEGVAGAEVMITINGRFGFSRLALGLRALSQLSSGNCITWSS